MLGLTDDTALRTPPSRLSRPAWSLRMTRLIARDDEQRRAAEVVHHDRPVDHRRCGLMHRILVDVLDDADDLAPDGGASGDSRMRWPSAAAAEPQTSRAKFSEMMATLVRP